MLEGTLLHYTKVYMLYTRYIDIYKYTLELMLSIKKNNDQVWWPSMYKQKISFEVEVLI